MMPWKCWESLSASDRKWWVEEYEDKSKNKSSSSSGVVAEEHVDTITVTLKMQMHLAGRDTVAMLRSKLYHMIDNIDMIQFTDNFGSELYDGHIMLSEIEGKKKELWMELKQKHKERGEKHKERGEKHKERGVKRTKP